MALVTSDSTSGLPVWAWELNYLLIVLTAFPVLAHYRTI